MQRLNELVSFNPLEMRLPTKSVSADGPTNLDILLCTSTTTGLSPSFPATAHGAPGSQKPHLLRLCAPRIPEWGAHRAHPP